MRHGKLYLTTAILSCYFIFLFFLLRTETIGQYINPKLSFLTVLALLLIGAMLFHNFTRLAASSRSEAEHRDHGHCQCHSHSHSERLGFSVYLLFLPIVLAVVVGPQALSYEPDRLNFAAVLPQPGEISPGTTGANNYSIANGQSWPESSPSGAAPAIGDAQEYTQMDIGNIIFDTLKAPQRKLTSSEIYLIGRVARPAQLKIDEIVLYRMVISCCAADGLPIGVLVKLAKPAEFRDNDWVGVRGRVQLIPFEKRLETIEPVANMVTPEEIYAHFTATEAFKIDPPRNEYLYP
jgi:uncharacterized repeat protein (TIGR03943 family)